MPRDGLQQYAPPPGTQGVANYTVESARYNTFVADITADQNNPRPIVAGGTGAANAHDAMVALSGEIAKQGPVANFDSFPFANGSFYCDAGATSAPTPSDAFTGTYYEHFNTAYAIIVATAVATGISYSRVKNAGTWGPWSAGMAADLNTAFVKKSGDTMSGGLAIVNPTGHSVLELNSLPANVNVLRGKKNSLSRWEVYLGDNAAESGANAGSNFGIMRIDDTGTAQLGMALSINRATGAWTISGALTTTAAVRSGGGYYFGSAGAANLNFDGTAFNLTGGGLNVAAHVRSAPTATTGTFYFGADASHYLTYDGTNYILNGGGFTVGGILAVNGNVVTNGSFRAGNLGSTGVYYFGNGDIYLYWDGIQFNASGGPLLSPYAPTNANHLTRKSYVDTHPQLLKMGTLIDPFGGRGYSFGVAAIGDFAIGATDVTFSAAFTASVNHFPVASVYGVDTNATCNLGILSASSVRIHSIAATTAALRDPQYYTIHDAGQ